MSKFIYLSTYLLWLYAGSINASNADTVEMTAFSCEGASEIFSGAQDGVPHHLYNAAILYSTGTCVKRNGQVAFSLFHKAAKSGVMDAYYNMAIMLHAGTGVNQDANAASEIFVWLASHNHKKTINYLESYREKYGDRLPILKLKHEKP